MYVKKSKLLSSHLGLKAVELGSVQKNIKSKRVTTGRFPFCHPFAIIPRDHVKTRGQFLNFLRKRL